LLLITVSIVTAQDAHPLKLNADRAVYRYDAERSYLEVYYAFTRASLVFHKEATGFAASAILQAECRRVGADSEPLRRLWRVPVTTEDTARLVDKHMIGKIHFICEPGRYLISVTARDENVSGKIDSVRMFVQVPKFSSTAPAFSDIELCSSITPTKPDSGNIFYKNTLEVVPNPTMLYGMSFQSLLYYSELYNVNLPIYKLRREVISSYGKTLTTSLMSRTGVNAARVEYGSTQVDRLPSGAYTLVLSCIDTTGAILTSSSKLFYVYNPEVPVDTMMIRQVSSEIALEFAALSEQELNLEFDKASYIATSEERGVWKSLAGSEPKKKFLTRFWNGRDSDPVTPENEFYQEYMKRIEEADELYRTAYRPGWKTDRGRVLVTYGKPDAVERNSSESDLKPYEIWTYDRIQSGVEFVFVDKGGFNNYELVHSTMRNELSDTNWKRHIQTY
jgi:GWxTD domain-containing protein